MSENQDRKSIQYDEIAVFALIPSIVGVLILASWMMELLKVGPYFLSAAVALAAVLIGGIQRFISGFRDIYNRRITVNVFVTIALIINIALGVFLEAAIIIFIMAVVGAFESYTLDKGRRSIRDLLDLAPKTATVRRGEGEATIPLSEIKVGDVVIVRPGERVAVDGVVVAGASSVNQAPITGESIPVEKFPGSELFSGSLNETGRLEARVTKTGEDTTLARIVHLVEEAQETKAPVQKLADRFTVWFLPTVLVLAGIGFLVWGNPRISASILLVACPCAFAIATPSAVTAGISNLARRGVLVKGGVFLESSGKLDTLLVDKTGTFTLGRPKVIEVDSFDGVSEADVLSLVAIAEKYSEHPLARSVITLASERKITVPDPDEFKVEAGMGVVARWDGREISVGNEKFLADRGVSVGEKVKQTVQDQTELGRTAILVANDRRAVGLIAIADEIRSEIPKVVALLKGMGVKITMLTGDNPRVAKSVAEEIGVDDFKAGLLPEQKQEVVKELQGEGHIVGMVGDGINDAPALALADVGIAMGAAGTDVAIETAAVTLMNDDLSRVAELIWMSRKVIRRIKLNIFLSIIYNAVGLVLSSLGMFTPLLAVIFQEAGCISVVFSSILLLWTKPNQ